VSGDGGIVGSAGDGAAAGDRGEDPTSPTTKPAAAPPPTVLLGARAAEFARGLYTALATSARSAVAFSSSLVSLATAQSVCFSALVLLYPGTLNAVVDVLQCRSERVTVAAYRSLVNDGTTLAALGAPAEPLTQLALLLASLTGAASGGDAAAAGAFTEDTIINVRVLAANPSVVRWRGAVWGGCGEGGCQTRGGWRCVWGGPPFVVGRCI
jgi:hypothetical protein